MYMQVIFINIYKYTCEHLSTDITFSKCFQHFDKYERIACKGIEEKKIKINIKRYFPKSLDVTYRANSTAGSVGQFNSPKFFPLGSLER